MLAEETNKKRERDRDVDYKELARVILGADGMNPTLWSVGGELGCP